MSSINFVNVYLLLIAIPLIVLFTVPFCIAVRKENRNGHNITSQILHVVMAVLIAFAAAGTSLTTVLTETNIYVVADVSYSANKNLNKVDEYIQKLNLPNNSKVGLVCFGKDYKVVSELGRQRDLKSVINTGVDDTETNIAEALNFTGGLFEENVIKRIVLITDGRQTDETDEYAVRRAVDALESMNVKVDAIFLNDNIDESTKEVQVSSVDFTASAFKNHDETVDVTIQSTCETRAAVTLERREGSGSDDYIRVDWTADRRLSPGRNIVSFKLKTDVGGTFDYRVKVEADDDTSNYNNTYTFTQKVSDNINILILSGDTASVSQLIDKYKTSATLDVYINCDDSGAANSFNVNYGKIPGVTVHIMAPGSQGKTPIPTTVTELCGYDEIILDNVNLTATTGSGEDFKWINVGTFLNSLDFVVKAGKTLVTIGNMNLNGVQSGNTDDGREDGSMQVMQSLNNMLPVKFGKSDKDPSLYTIILDVSTSLDDKMRFQNAKQIAIKLLDSLNEQDKFCIITFNGLTYLTQRPILVKDGRAAARTALENMQAGTGTVLGGGLKAAYDQILGQNAKDKQVLMITDGVSADDVPGMTETDVYGLVGQMYDSGIVTSVVSVGDRRGDEHSTHVDLQRLAEDCGHGRYTLLDVDFKDSPPGALLGDIAADLTGTKIAEEDVVSTQIVNRNDQILNHIDKTNIPKVNGGVVNYAKPSAVTVMNVVYQNNKTSPLYAYWGYGNGKVASFTSGVNQIDNWAKDGNTTKDTFIENLFEVSVPDEKTDYPYSIDINHEGSTAFIRLALAARDFDASAVTMKLQVENPGGEITEQNFADDGYYYTYSLLTKEIGRYNLKITYSYGETTQTSEFVLNMSYPGEYNEFATYEASSLNQALNGRGKVSLDGSLTVENDAEDMGVYEMDFTIPLLIICVVIYIVDIVIRKLKWEDVVSFFGGFKKDAQPNAAGGKKG